MVSLLGVAYYAGTALFRPAGQEFSAAQDHHRNVYAVSGPGTKPGVIPILAHGRPISSTRDIQRDTDDLPVVPAGRKLGLAWPTGSVPVPATVTGLVSIEYVRGALGSYA